MGTSLIAKILNDITSLVTSIANLYNMYKIYLVLKEESFLTTKSNREMIYIGKYSTWIPFPFINSSRPSKQTATLYVGHHTV